MRQIRPYPQTLHIGSVGKAAVTFLACRFHENTSLSQRPECLRSATKSLPPCARRHAFEAEEHPVPNADVEEVTNYLDALAYARGQLAAKREKVDERCHR